MKLVSLATILLLTATSALGATTTWNGLAGNRDWADNGNWSGSAPAAGDTAQITNNSDVLISAASAQLGTLNMTGGTLTFTNWSTILSATNVTISGGTITLPNSFTNNAMSNRVYFACSNFFLGTSGGIDVSEKGFMGGQISTPIGNFPGQGPGGGRNSASIANGGGHGGKGGRWVYPGYNPTYGWDYGSLTVPTAPGSGGGGETTGEPGGDGGGVVRIDASGSVTINGVVQADGEPYAAGDHRGGWGSGGSIYISCDTFGGTNGIVRADGGRHYSSWGGGGGGGRVSVVYDTNAQASLQKPTVTLSSKGGLSSSATVTSNNGDPGTVYIPDTTILDPTWLPHNGRMYFAPAITSWTVSAIAATNGWLWIAQTNMTITVTNDVLVSGTDVHLETPEGATVYIGGDLIVTNDAEFSAHGGITNASSPDYSSLVSITGELVIADGATLYPWSQATNGGSVLFRASYFRLDSNGTINADLKGYRGGWYAAAGYQASGYGPGGGQGGLSTIAAGGGYGGKGNDATAGEGGAAYGSVAMLVNPGSGGGARNYTGYQGGRGGGLVRIELTGDADVNGTITADGGLLSFGAGSGGGVLIACTNFSGTGTIRANGKDANGLNGGGGGGRIAIHYTSATPGISLSAAPGRGPYYQFVSGVGTVYYRAEIGSIYLSDASIVTHTNVLAYTGLLYIPGLTSWSVDSLILTNNAYVGFATNGFTLTVTNDVSGPGGKTKLLLSDSSVATVGGNMTAGFDIRESAKLTVAGDVLMTNHYDWGSWVYPFGEFRVGGDLILTNALTAGLRNGRLWVQSGPTNGVLDYGALVAVTGTMTICSNVWVYSYSADAFDIYPYSRCTNGGSPLYRVGNLDLRAVARINAANTGWRRGGPTVDGWTGKGYGQGGGLQSSTTVGGGGGAYGGDGGDGSSGAGGSSYGMTNAPMDPGSGSGPRNGTVAQGVDGGGFIHIIATNAVSIDGTVIADGKSSTAYGGGSGGGIWIDCKEFSGAASGSLTANGGNGSSSGGGGGGGRIAVWYGDISASARSNLLAGQDALVPLLDITNSYSGFQGLATADPGTGNQSGGTGTVVFVTVESPEPKISNVLATNVTSTSANLNAVMTSTGAATTTVTVFWGDSDQADTMDAWAKTNIFPGTPGIGLLTTNVSLSPNTVYYYRYYGDNGAGTGWAPTTSVFSTWAVTIAATTPNADEDGQVPGTVTVARASATTNFALTVYYVVSGSAGNGTDYQLIGTNVVMQAGESNATVTITPITDGDTGEGPETAILTLTGDAYVIGSMNSATVTIANVGSLSSSNSWVAGVGNWEEPSNWSEGYVPVFGQDVTVTGQVSLSESTAALSSLHVTNGTLTVLGWSSKIEATNMWVYGAGTIALPAAFTNGGASNRIWIACSNLTVLSGGSVDADESGYDGGVKQALFSYNGQGPGGGANSGSFGRGGGHGGKGGRWIYPGYDPPYGWDYGSPSAPVTPGSGGGADSDTTTQPGGDGGGVIRVEATGTVTVNGTISSDGGDYQGDGSRGGFGAGGSIYITCDEFGGSNGIVQAEGGVHVLSWGGGGGGGRIAIVYNASAQAAASKPRVVFSVLGGPANNGTYNSVAGLYGGMEGEYGTLYFTDTAILDQTWLPHGGVVSFPPAVTSWTISSMLVSNGWLRIGQSNMTVSVTGNMLVTGSGTHFETGEGGKLICGGDLLITNNAELTIHSGPTNGAVVYGSEVTVAGDLIVANGATLYSVSESRNGGSPFYAVDNLRVHAGGLIDADAFGWRGGWYSVPGYQSGGYGPGGGLPSSLCGAGGGYGGKGGDSASSTGGGTYGDRNAPAYPGSGGANRNYTAAEGGTAGGLFRLEASRAIVLDGTISADGNKKSYGGGSGGGIYLRCLRFEGEATGFLSAEGAAASGSNGSGGGGRIAIWRVPYWDIFSGTNSVAGGVGGNENGAVGTYTVNIVKVPQGTIFIIR